MEQHSSKDYVVGVAEFLSVTVNFIAAACGSPSPSFALCLHLLSSVPQSLYSSHTGLSCCSWKVPDKPSMSGPFQKDFLCLICCSSHILKALSLTPICSLHLTFCSILLPLIPSNSLHHFTVLGVWIPCLSHHH